TFEVVSPINCNTNLSIFSMPKRNIRNPRTEVDYTIRIFAAFRAVLHSNSLGADVYGRLHVYDVTSVLIDMIGHKVDLILVLVYFFPGNIRLRKNFTASVLTSSNLRDLDVVDLVAFIFQSSNGSLE